MMAPSDENEQSPDEEQSSGEFEELAAEVSDAGDTHSERVSLDDVLQQLDHRGYGPLLFLPAVLSISPLGGIPGMSIATGSLIILIAIQLPFRSQPWFPAWIERLSLPRQRFDQSIATLKPWFKRLDLLVSERLLPLTSPPMRVTLGALICLLAIAYFPLALVPFGVFAPGLAISLFAAGLTARNGILIGLGLICTAVTAGLVGYLLLV